MPVARPCLGARLLLLFLQRGVLFFLLPQFLPRCLVTTPPPEVNEDKSQTKEDGQGGPHALNLFDAASARREPSAVSESANGHHGAVSSRQTGSRRRGRCRDIGTRGQVFPAADACVCPPCGCR